MFLPNSKSPDKDLNLLKFEEFDVIFMHQTFAGAISESGYKLDGMSTERFEGLDAKIFSGDIHVPQQLGPITYIGAPYHINFGSQFEPRIFLADKNFNIVDDQYPTIKKHILEIKDPEEIVDVIELRAGDYVKIKLLLRRAEFVDWPKHRDTVKEVCNDAGLIVKGIDLI